MRKMTSRNGLLARIHIAKKELGMDDATYRETLQGNYGVETSAKLVIADLKGFATLLQGQLKKPFPGRPLNMDSVDRGPMLGKIEALLADAKRPWAYADGMAKKMFKVEKVAWCKPDQLHRIIAALTYDAKRRKAKIL